MFQRLKNTINQTIAEEQARAKAASDAQSQNAPTAQTRRTPSVSRSNSGVSPARRPKAKNPSQDAPKDGDGDGAVNPDPAVFEAAFVIDDEEPSRAATPLPPSGERFSAEAAKVDKGAEENGASGTAERGKVLEKAQNKGDAHTAPAEQSEPKPKPASPEMSPQVRARLRKLEKLEATYPELLRSYRIAHSRATSIEPFERALRENTPLTSIKDPDALIEYLNQMNLKGDMVMDELKRVSAEKDDFKKKFTEAGKEISELKQKIAELEAAKSPGMPRDTQKLTNHADGGTKDENESAHTRSPSSAKSPVQQVLGLFSPKQKPTELPERRDVDEGKKTSDDDFFSYDNEIPQLQAENEANKEQIEKLKAEVDSLKSQLATTKESSAGLVEKLEKATRDLSELRDSGALAESLKTQVEARDVEIKTLTERLTKSEAQLKELQAQLEREKASTAAVVKEKEDRLAETTSLQVELEAGLKKVTEAKSALDTRIVDLTTEIKSLRQSKLDNEQKIEELTKQLQTPPTPSTTAPSENPEVPPTPSQSSNSSKKNKKKKKKGGAGAAAINTSVENAATRSSPQPSASPVEGPSVADLQAEIETLKRDVSKKDEQIEKLSNKRKTEEDLREEIETLQENLVDIGQEHVDAKERIKALEVEKKQLQGRIAELEKELEASKASENDNSKLQEDFDALKQELEGLKTKSVTLQSDLGASQQLAQSRYKDLTELREILQKAQPELKSLRQESATLKITKDELAAKTIELRNMEKRERDLKTEVVRVQRLATDRDTEIKSLRDKLTAETNTRLRLEDAQRVSGRDLRRAEAEKIELSAKEEKATRELQKLQDEMTKLRPRIKELEGDAVKLRKEQVVLREEAELRTSQYTNAQNLLGSMRDQTHELTIQLKEAQGQAESFDEELAECRKLLSERTREAETMRRLLADVDERADSKVREMRARLDAAIEERDRLEDESSSLARRKARELEELKQKLRDLDRESKTLATEKDDLEHKEKEWRRRRQELEAVEAKADAEVNEMRAAVSNLQATLDASEKQVRDAEKAKNELRRSLDDYRIRYDKLAKETKSLQAKLNSAGGVSSSGRSSMDSTRSGGVNGSGTPEGQRQQNTSTDVMYLKTILLQFLEQKDNRLRAQLVPVLGKLLRFDKSDEQKWMSAVQHIGAR